MLHNVRNTSNKNISPYTSAKNRSTSYHSKTNYKLHKMPISEVKPLHHIQLTNLQFERQKRKQKSLINSTSKLQFYDIPLQSPTNYNNKMDNLEQQWLNIKSSIQATERFKRFYTSDISTEGKNGKNKSSRYLSIKLQSNDFGFSSSEDIEGNEPHIQTVRLFTVKDNYLPAQDKRFVPITTINLPLKTQQRSELRSATNSDQKSTENSTFEKMNDNVLKKARNFSNEATERHRKQIPYIEKVKMQCFGKSKKEPISCLLYTSPSPRDS